MSYTHTTFAQLKTALLNRLGDTGAVYWLSGVDGTITDEIGRYILEALQTWGLATNYWRDTGTFTTTANVGFYNTDSLTNTSGTALLNSTITDQDLSANIQYHLLEPATGSTWTGSEQFTLADVTGALQRRRDQFLLETGATLSTSTQALGAGAQVVDLADTTLTIRRISWKGATSSADWALFPEDISSQRNYTPDYLITPDLPQTYSSLSMRPLRLQLAPPTNEPGTLNLLVTQSGVPLTAGGVALGIPDDMAWVVKWGALADMLGRQGPGQDLTRSYFCERRWRLGVELAKIYGGVINAEINGFPLSPDAVANLDQYDPNWLSSAGTPTIFATLRNYVALSPCPDGVYSVLLDVVRKANLPATDGAYVQIGREYLDIILDYAEHLATFKCGGYEFRHTFRGAENFFNMALQYNSALAAKNPTLRDLVRQSTVDDYVLPTQQALENRPLQAVSKAGVQTDEMRQTAASI